MLFFVIRLHYKRYTSYIYLVGTQVTASMDTKLLPTFGHSKCALILGEGSGSEHCCEWLAMAAEADLHALTPASVVLTATDIPGEHAL